MASLDESAEAIADRILQILNLSENSEEMTLEDVKRNIFNVETNTNIMLIEGLDTLALENKHKWNPSVFSPPRPPPLPRTITMRRPSTASESVFQGNKKPSPRRLNTRSPARKLAYVASSKFSPRQRRQNSPRARAIGAMKRPATSSVIRKQTMASPVRVRRSNHRNTNGSITPRRKMSPRPRNSPLSKSIRASQRIYKNSALKQRKKYHQLKEDKVRKYEKYNHQGFVYYSSKNLSLAEEH